MKQSHHTLSAVILVTLVAWSAFLFLVFRAPVEQQMGVVQKVFYIHVPSAYAMYLGFVLCGVGSFIYLFWHNQRWDRIAAAAAEVGLVFCAIVLITGPLWARKAWGVYWTWDPRLTTTLLAGMLYLAYVALRTLGAGTAVERRLSAGLAVLGTVDLPIIHYSVRVWRGQHPTVISARGGGLDPRMVPPLVMGFVVVTLLFVVLVWVRAALERASSEVERVAYDH